MVSIFYAFYLSPGWKVEMKELNFHMNENILLPNERMKINQRRMCRKDF